MNTEQRLDRLEKLWEHDHNILESLAIHIPKLADHHIKLLNALDRWRRAVGNDHHLLTDLYLKVDETLQDYMKYQQNIKTASKKKRDTGYEPF